MGGGGGRRVLVTTCWEGGGGGGRGVRTACWVGSAFSPEGGKSTVVSLTGAMGTVSPGGANSTGVAIVFKGSLSTGGTGSTGVMTSSCFSVVAISATAHEIPITYYCTVHSSLAVTYLCEDIIDNSIDNCI